jgi:hypothetical protein
MSSSGARLVAGTLPLVVLLAGCASSSPEAGPAPESHVVVGSGSTEDRQAIDASDQHIFQTEEGIVSAPVANTSTPSPPASSTPAPTNSQPTTP